MATAERGWTAGPWAWFGNAKNNEIYLATVDRGRRYVMGFSRWGMRGAQPSFQPSDRGLVEASNLLTFEVGNRDVVGVEQAKADESVYRLDINGIACADAHLIAAAPCLADFVQEHDAYMLASGYSGPDDPALHPGAAENWRKCRAALARANPAAKADGGEA
jgi:hypothetical protein